MILGIIKSFNFKIVSSFLLFRVDIPSIKPSGYDTGIYFPIVDYRVRNQVEPSRLFMSQFLNYFNPCRIPVKSIRDKSDASAFHPLFLLVLYFIGLIFIGGEKGFGFELDS